MLRPKTSHSIHPFSSSGSPSWRTHGMPSVFDAAHDEFNSGDTAGNSPSYNRRSRSASSRLATASAPSPSTGSLPSSFDVLPTKSTPIESPLSSFSRPQSSMSSRGINLRPQSGATHIDAEALIHASAYHGVPITKRTVPSEKCSQILQPVIISKSGKQRDIYVRSGDSVVMFDEEGVRFSSFVNSVEVALAQLPPSSQSVVKDRVVAACNILERLCVFQTPVQRLIKLIKTDIYRGIWKDYQPSPPHIPEKFEIRRAYFEDCLGVAGAIQSITQQAKDALDQATSMKIMCNQKNQQVEELESILFATKEENLSLKEKEGSFQEIFARSLVRMRSDQAKRIEVEKQLRDMQLKEAAFNHMIENEREESRQRVKSVEVTVKQMEQAFVDGERKRQELQHVMDSMFSRSSYIQLYRNHEKKKILLMRAEAQLRFKLMSRESSFPQIKDEISVRSSSEAKSDKIKKAVSAFAISGKRNQSSTSQRTSHAETSEDMQFFNGIGDSRDLPRYLRSCHPVRNQLLQLQDTRNLVRQFWNDFEATFSGSPLSFGFGIHEYLNSYFGKKIESVSLAYSLISASHKYSGFDIFIEMFWKCWSGEFSEDVVLDLIRLFQDFERFLISKQGGTLIPIDTFEKLLASFFPQKDAAQLSELLICMQSSTAFNGKDVDVSLLFDKNFDAESPFLQLLWRQGLNERSLFATLLEESIFKLEPMAALKVKCRHIRNALFNIDPNRPSDVLEQNLQLGFGMPHGCAVSSDDTVSFDDFMLLFSTGAMRLYSKLSVGSSKSETTCEK